MYNLQELFENGYIEKIEIEDTHLGRGYNISVKLRNYSIYSVSISVGIDESLDDAIVLINKMIEVDDEIAKQNKRPARAKGRLATDEDLKKLFGDDDEAGE